MAMHEPDSSKRNGDRGEYVQWLGLATEFCGVLAVCCYGGYKLDELLHTSPWFLIGGFFTGFAGMMVLIVKQIQRMR
jgi:F0F1-type ATP synthase assembly protein I